MLALALPHVPGRRLVGKLTVTWGKSVLSHVFNFTINDWLNK